MSWRASERATGWWLGLFLGWWLGFHAREHLRGVGVLDWLVLAGLLACSLLLLTLPRSPR